MLAFESIIAWIVIGAVAGWLAGLIVKGYGFGLIGNIVVGNRGRWDCWLSGATAWPVHRLDRRKYHCRNTRRGHSACAGGSGPQALARYSRCATNDGAPPGAAEIHESMDAANAPGA